MSKVKREHYVPQAYLRGFTEDGEHLFVFDKSTKTRFGTSVSRIACERYFYDLSDKQHPVLSYSGLQSEGIEIAFPLNSRYILAMLERTFHANLEALDCDSMPINNDGVTYYNGLQVDSSYRWVCCQTDILGPAKRVLKESPRRSR